MRGTPRQIGWVTAAALVVANMIGTGAFTALGLQLEQVHNSWSILALWIMGGLVSLFGALSYAELGTHIPRSGGEYRFLSELVHPFLGYLSGWVSLTVGFTAAVSLAAMAMAAYIDHYVGMPASWMAVAAVLLLSAVHSFSIQQSGFFQDVFTISKVALLLLLIGAGLFLPAETHALQWGSGWKSELTRPGFAVALIFGLYAFSGWNAAAYIVEEIRQPARNVPRALIGGTLLVSVLYLLLQMAFLRQAPLADLRGTVEVGQVAAYHMFGPRGGRWISFFIALFLISSISAMIWVGSRVVRAIAEDSHLWRFLARDNERGVPVRAIWFQATISIALILSGSFEAVLIYSGFVLQLFTTITVASIFRRRRLAIGAAGGYRSPFYPLPQVLYLLVSAWILYFLMATRPGESALGLLNLALGALLYWIDHRWMPRRNG